MMNQTGPGLLLDIGRAAIFGDNVLMDPLNQQISNPFHNLPSRLESATRLITIVILGELQKPVLLRSKLQEEYARFERDFAQRRGSPGRNAQISVNGLDTELSRMKSKKPDYRYLKGPKGELYRSFKAHPVDCRGRINPDYEEFVKTFKALGYDDDELPQYAEETRTNCQTLILLLEQGSKDFYDFRLSREALIRYMPLELLPLAVRPAEVRA